jgi:hypothetical protein
MPAAEGSGDGKGVLVAVLAGCVGTEVVEGTNRLEVAVLEARLTSAVGAPWSGAEHDDTRMIAHAMVADVATIPRRIKEFQRKRARPMGATILHHRPVRS